jgi:hypothetical protein
MPEVPDYSAVLFGGQRNLKDLKASPDTTGTFDVHGAEGTHQCLRMFLEPRRTTDVTILTESAKLD